MDAAIWSRYECANPSSHWCQAAYYYYEGAALTASPPAFDLRVLSLGLSTHQPVAKDLNCDASKDSIGSWP